MKFAKKIGTDMIGFIATIALASVSYALAGVMVFLLKETKGVQLTSGN